MTTTLKPRYPKSVPYIIGNEAAERFSYYGMKALLANFFVSQFAFSEAASNEKVHLFISLTYIMAIFGGLAADWFVGKYKVIFYLSFIYVIGHVCLAVFESKLNGFMFGMLLIALGAGGIKPCVSALVGDQFNESNKSLIPKIFGWFYFSINIGAFFAQLIIPGLFASYGPSIAFGVPGIFMALALFIFWLGRKKYTIVPAAGYKKANFFAINFYALKNFSKKIKGQSLLDVAKEKYGEKPVANMKAVWAILAVFVFMPVWWALFNQNGSEWTLQARELDLHTDLRFWIFDWDFLNFTVQPQQVQAINAVEILLFIPLMTSVIYPFIERLGIQVTPLRKIAAGFIVTALTFVLIAWLQTRIDRGEHPTVMWQYLAYTILTFAEILVSVTALEYAYTQAPEGMKSTIMSFWLATTSIGSMLVSLMNSNIDSGGFFSKFTGANYYWFFCGVMAFVALLFILLSGKLKQKHT